MHVLWRYNHKKTRFVFGNCPFRIQVGGPVIISDVCFNYKVVLVYARIISFQFLYNLTLTFTKELGAVSLYISFPTFLFKQETLK